MRGCPYGTGRRQTATAEEFSPEFKRDAVELVLSTSRPIAEVAKELGRRHFRTRAEARRAIFPCINYYNHRRLHTAWGYRPPAEYEQLLHQPPIDPLTSTLAA